MSIHNRLQIRETYLTTTQNNIDNFIKDISKIKNKIGTHYMKVIGYKGIIKENTDESNKKTIEVCDNIISGVK